MGHYTQEEIEKLCRLARLTQKEKTVFYLTCEDVKQPMIGKQLKVSAAMIRIHMHRIYQKCDIAPQNGPRSMEKELIRQYGEFAPLVKENRIPVENLPCDQFDLTPKHYPTYPKKSHPKEQKQGKKTSQTKDDPPVSPVPPVETPTSAVVSVTPADQGKKDSQQFKLDHSHKHPKRAHLWKKPPKKENPGRIVETETQSHLPMLETPTLSTRAEPELEVETALPKVQEFPDQKVQSTNPLPSAPADYFPQSPNVPGESCSTEIVLNLIIVVVLVILAWSNFSAGPFSPWAVDWRPQANHSTWLSPFPLLNQLLHP